MALPGDDDALREQRWEWCSHKFIWDAREAGEDPTTTTKCASLEKLCWYLNFSPMKPIFGIFLSCITEPCHWVYDTSRNFWDTPFTSLLLSKCNGQDSTKLCNFAQNWFASKYLSRYSALKWPYQPTILSYSQPSLLLLTLSHIHIHSHTYTHMHIVSWTLQSQCCLPPCPLTQQPFPIAFLLLVSQPRPRYIIQRPTSPFRIQLVCLLLLCLLLYILD